MRGQIIARGPRTFLVRVYAGKKNGKRVYPSKTVHGSRRDAERVRTKMLRELDQGSLTVPTKTSLAEWVAEWQESTLRGRVKPRTFHTYVESLKLYVLEPLGEMRLTSLRAWDIQKLYQGMLARDLSPSTVRGVHAVLRSALKQAVLWDILPANPADAVDLPSPRKSQERPLTADQARAFLNAAADSAWRAYYHVMLVCGLRPGEAFGLQWSHVDLSRGRLAVRHAVTYDDKRAATLDEPKSGSRRNMPIPPELVQVLADHREATRDIVNPLDLVFPSIDGDLIHPDRWSQREFKRIAAQIGAPDGFRLYDLRHTCATLMMGGGIHPKIAGERLGHQSTDQTLNTYSHVTPTMQQAATDQLAGVIYQVAATRTNDPKN